MTIHEVLTYRIEDFILFSPYIYADMVSSYNQQFWPLHIVIIGAFTSLAIAIMRAVHTVFMVTILFLLFAISMSFIAIFYFKQYYITINPFAEHMAYGFFLQSAFIMLSITSAWKKHSTTNHEALFNRHKNIRHSHSFLPLFFCIAVYPALKLITQNEAAIISSVGIDPDMTMAAFISLGHIVRLPFYTYIIPTLWLVFSGMTYLGLGEKEHILVFSVLISLALLVITRTYSSNKYAPMTE